MMRRSVDLPQPDGPTSETKDPFSMLKVASSSATTDPFAKVLPTEVPVTTGCDACATAALPMLPRLV